MDTYTKLFSSILRSTIWQASKETRLVWITLLAIKDARQVAESSVPGLAKLAGVSLEECELALKELLGPDPYSRSKESEGRRIREVEGGWYIINGEKYQQRMSVEERREYKRVWMANKRAVLAKVKRKAIEDSGTEVVVEAVKEANEGVSL